MHDYAARVFEEQQKKAPWEKEFLQSVEEVFASLDDVLNAHPEYEENCILERMITPERIITFQVPWVDDNGKINVNTGYRVQFNGSLGPYKGGLRFHPTVTLSVLKFLGFSLKLRFGKIFIFCFQPQDLVHGGLDLLNFPLGTGSKQFIKKSHSNLLKSSKWYRLL